MRICFNKQSILKFILNKFRGVDLLGKSTRIITQKKIYTTLIYICLNVITNINLILLKYIKIYSQYYNVIAALLL